MANSDKVCRACLNTKDTFEYNFRVNVCHELYLFCTSVKVSFLLLKVIIFYTLVIGASYILLFQVSLNDNLPKSICSTCYKLLNSYAEFKKTCIQSNQKLISLYEDKQRETVEIEVKVKQESLDEVDGKYIHVSSVLTTVCFEIKLNTN